MPDLRLSGREWGGRATSSLDEPRGLEVHLAIRDPSTGAVVRRFSLRICDSSLPMGAMSLSAATPGEVTERARIAGEVAGRIQRPPDDLERDIADWLGHLGARNKTPRTIAAFREIVARAKRECGWSDRKDLTADNVVGWLDRMRAGWKGTTYNRNLSVFRSLTKFLAGRGRIEHDPLAVCERCDDDGADGSRAATLEEARAIIREAYLREQHDRRAAAGSALQVLCLFAHGCRHGEPEKWRRRHLALDHAFPHVMWDQAISKNHKRADIPLTAELAVLLRRHLAAMDAMRAAQGLGPAGPEDPVFPVVSNRSTFRKHRDRAGVAAVDYRGRRLSPHSARKFFSTELTKTVPEKMVDKLMRHSGRVEHRYFDPTLEDKAKAIATLPGLWPVPVHVDNSDPGSCENRVDLTNRKADAHDVDATPAVRTTAHPPKSPGPEGQRRCSNQPGLRPGASPAGSGDRLGPAGSAKGTARVRSSPALRPEMPSIGLEKGMDRDALAGLFENLARLLRSQGAGCDEDRADVG